MLSVRNAVELRKFFCADELLIIFPEARATSPDSRANSTTPAPELAGHPYLTVFRDTVRELAERKEANSGVKVRANCLLDALGCSTDDRSSGEDYRSARRRLDLAPSRDPLHYAPGSLLCRQCLLQHG